MWFVLVSLSFIVPYKIISYQIHFSLFLFYNAFEILKRYINYVSFDCCTQPFGLN